MCTVGEGPSCASDLSQIRGKFIAAELNFKANFMLSINSLTDYVWELYNHHHLKIFENFQAQIVTKLLDLKRRNCQLYTMCHFMVALHKNFEPTDALT